MTCECGGSMDVLHAGRISSIKQIVTARCRDCRYEPTWVQSSVTPIRYRYPVGGYIQTRKEPKEGWRYQER